MIISSASVESKWVSVRDRKQKVKVKPNEKKRSNPKIKGESKMKSNGHDFTHLGKGLNDRKIAASWDRAFAHAQGQKTRQRRAKIDADWDRIFQKKGKNK